METTIVRAATYLRVSDDRDGESTSISQQRDEVAEKLAEKGWTAVVELQDPDISASEYSTKKRPQWADLLDLIRNGEIDAIVAWDFDRMLRKPRELEDLIELLASAWSLDRTKGTFPIITCDGDIDLSTGEGRHHARNKVANAALESDKTSKRVRRSKARIAREGGILGPVRAFGWVPSVKKGQPDSHLNGMVTVPEEAAAIRDAAARILAGASLNGIATEWNLLNYKRPHGASLWSATTVRSVLSSPRNAGRIQFRGEDFGPAQWSAILDKDTYDQLIALFNDPGRKTGPRRRAEFSGIFRCGVCDATMFADSYRGKRAWRCKQVAHAPQRCGKVSLTGAYVEDLVRADLIDKIESGALHSLFDGVAAPDEGATIKAEIAQLEDEIERFSDMMTNGVWSFEKFDVKVKPMVHRLKALRAADAPKRRPATVLLPYTGQPGVLTAAWETFSEGEKNAMMHAAIKHVLLYPASPERPTPGDRVDPPEYWR